MTLCNMFDPENIFKRFKVIEFPMSFVGLSTTQELDVEEDITGSAYLKTSYRGNLMSFEEAREVSASHRAYILSLKNNHTLNISFKPITECISKVMTDNNKNHDNRFVCDLHLIKADGSCCCSNEKHLEVGRFYISGQYEFCKISHTPEKVYFGEVIMKTKVSKYVRIRNESNFVSAKFCYNKILSYDVTPDKFIIPPNSSKRIVITLCSNSLIVAKKLTFHIKNPHDSFSISTFYEQPVTDTNFLMHSIDIQTNIVIDRKVRKVVIQSLHTLPNDPLPCYTYLDEELRKRNERKELAKQILLFSKTNSIRAKIIKKFYSKDNCYSNSIVEKSTKLFCELVSPRTKSQDLFNILFTPLSMDFGRIGIKTYGTQYLNITNNSDCNVTIRFLKAEFVVYTENKLCSCTVKLKSMSEANLALLVYGHTIGSQKGSFKYVIDNKHYREYQYLLQVGNPSLFISANSLKFGMVTNESFVTSVPVKIYNFFNVPVNFEWSEGTPEMPFEIFPISGSIAQHQCKICDVIFNPSILKLKSYEFNFISKGEIVRPFHIEANVMSRKLAVKFLTSHLSFKDMGLNLETIETVKLENASREFAYFGVVEPLLPGMKVDPMGGVINPKSLIVFTITIQIACVLEFYYDLVVKINNKENIILTLTGNVVDPKINIFPKSIYLSRIPLEMITYVPVSFNNFGTVKAIISVVNTGDDDIFNVYSSQGNEKQLISAFNVEPDQTKTVFVKVYDTFRREYDMYIPFQINGLIGPPNQDPNSLELHYYVAEHEKQYESSLRTRVKSINKEISHFRIGGVITVPWVDFSINKFELRHNVPGRDCIDFTMTNISKFHLHVCIMTTKLAPHFVLDFQTKDHQSIITESHIKFELDPEEVVSFHVHFIPRGLGKFVAVAILYLDPAMSIPYSNLTFIGRRDTPHMAPSSHHILFPPCYVGTEVSRILSITFEEASRLEDFTFASKEESCLSVKFMDCRNIEKQDEVHTLITVLISACSLTAYARSLTLIFRHDCGSVCNVLISFCFTNCPLTMHSHSLVPLNENPYPFYPPKGETKLYKYLETCTSFLERWLYHQGFRRELYPTFPDTFHAISPTLESCRPKSKGINVSYLSFMRRIAGPLMKHIPKQQPLDIDDPYKSVKEIYESYRTIIKLLRARGAHLWGIQAKFLLSYEQFIKYHEYESPKFNPDYHFTEELKSNKKLFHRLAKQSWLDLILQSYKVFAVDSCFFDCVCVSGERDITKILVDWYNEQTRTAHSHLLGNDKPVKIVTNLTSDLQDGIAIISSISNRCPFLKDHFSLMCEVNKDDPVGDIIHNACLIIEAFNHLRLYFPLSSKDFLEPNFLQMLFLSIRLYVALPMFEPKCKIEFSPPLLRASNRHLTINAGQESMQINGIILNNHKNSFSVEKQPFGTVKKTVLNVKYFANFVSPQSAILLVHCFNKTRLFDTYNLFYLQGNVESLSPLKKCKATGIIYHPNKADILVYSPFLSPATFTMLLVNDEPTIPVNFQQPPSTGFFINRVILLEKEIVLQAFSETEFQESKVHLKLYCLSTQDATAWLWFRSDVGEFFVKITTQCRWDMALDTIEVGVKTWPLDPCSCGESCACYRTTILMIPHRNELMVKALRCALLEYATDRMIQIFDQLIETPTGLTILKMLLMENGTNMSEVLHILRPENIYSVTSRSLFPQIDRVTFKQYTNELLPLPVTLPSHDSSEKYNLMFVSECGMDARLYKIVFLELNE